MAKNSCSTSLITREMQIKTTKRDHLTSQNGHHKKNLQTISAGEDVEKRESSYTVGGNVNWYNHCGNHYGCPGGSTAKNLPAVQKTWVQSLGWEDPLEKEMATHSSIFAWMIPWTEEPGRLQSIGSQSQDPTKQLNFHFSFRYGEQCEGCLKS